MANLNTTSLITNKPGIIKMSQFASIQSAVPKFFNHPHSVATQRAAGCIAIGFGILYLVKQASDSFFKSDENPSAPIAGKDASSLASSRNFSLITSRDVPSSSYGLNPPKVSYKRKDLFR
ncbi:MAG: hypothetical protein GWP59_08510, partial [Chlamydiales bacterium]|nr:hypothetical protein [Chlamydiales bacterium]